MPPRKRTTTTTTRTTRSLKAVKSLEDHPARRPDIEELLNKTGVSWTFEPEVALGEIDMERSLRNQARINKVLDQPTVETYIEAMKRGDIFPALISYFWNNTSKRVLIDGNHRAAAHKATKTRPAVYQLAKDTDPNAITLLTFEANAKHGLPNTVDERLEHAMAMLHMGSTNAEAAARLNLSVGQVSRRKTLMDARDRVRDAGLKLREWDQIPMQSQIKLNAIKTDEGFSTAVDLVFKAQLRGEEIPELVKEVNSTRSGNEQRAIIQRMRDAKYKKRIQAGGGGAFRRERAAITPRGKLILWMGALGTISGPEDTREIVKSAALAEIPDLINTLTVTAEWMFNIAEELEKKAADLGSEPPVETEVASG